MRATTLLQLTTLAIAAGSTAAYAAPNLVTNGGFESTSLTSSVSTQIGGAGGFGQFVTGWIEDGSTVNNVPYAIWFPNAAASQTENARGQYSGSGKEKLYPTVTPSPGGGAFVGLDGALGSPGVAGSQASINQTINGLTIGQMYTLTFDWAAGQLQSRSGPTDTFLAVSFGGSTVDTPAEPAMGNFNGWFGQSYTFTATGASELLSFLAVGSIGNLPPMALLDDVSLTLVPEPASLAVLGLALTTLGLVRRHRA